MTKQRREVLSIDNVIGKAEVVQWNVLEQTNYFIKGIELSFEHLLIKT